MNLFSPSYSRADLLFLAPVAAIVLTACGGSDTVQQTAPLLSGAQAPASTDGSNGSYYLNTTTGDLFGPKAADAWPSTAAMNLSGKAGAAGTNGANGINGTDGTNGTNGATVLSGSTAPAAATGAVGDFYIDTTNSTIYGPKSAAGWPMGVSLKGMAGSNGTNGTNGTSGTNGADGKTILTGTGAPAAGAGNNGDLYLNTTNSSIYGPKTAAGWGNAVSLVGQTGDTGATGSNGTNGKTLLNGTTNPADSTGVEGDFYINTQANTLWGPKGTSAWPTLSVSMQGTTGATGAKGDTGATGAAGKTILNGANDPILTEGVVGDFFIQTTSKTLFGPKTDSGWGTGFGLVGAKGDTGNTGATGARGNSVLNGTVNPIDSDGVQGDFYINTNSKTLFGPKGATSWPGSGVSMEGTTGAQGAQGVAGKTILSGAGTPADSSGTQGDFYINTTDTTLWGPKGASTWPTTTLSLKGAKGDTGTNGTNGNKIWASSTAPTHNASGVSTAPAGALVNDLYIQTGSSPKLFTLGAGGWDAGVSLGGGSSAAGVTFQLLANKVGGTGETLPLITSTNPTQIIFNNSVVTGFGSTGNTYDSATGTFTVGSSGAGLYQIQSYVRTPDHPTPASTVPVWMMIEINGSSYGSTNNIYGQFPPQASNRPAGLKGTGEISAITYLNAGDFFKIKATGANSSTVAQPINADAGSNLMVVKLN